MTMRTAKKAENKHLEATSIAGKLNVANSEIRDDGARLSEVLMVLFLKYTFSRSLETGKKEPQKKMKVKTLYKE